MPKKLAVLIVTALSISISISISLSLFSLSVGVADAAVAVRDGESIQEAIDAAAPGDTIEVYSGTYQESIDIKKPLILRGIDSGSGSPLVDADDGSAIILSADGITLEGLSARSSSGWGGDAGIMVLSKDNTIRNNSISGGSSSGMALLDSSNNTVSGNVVEGNRNEGISLKNCNSNLLEGNTVSGNKYGIKLESSGVNVVRGNTIAGNRFEGVYLQDSAKNIMEGNYIEDNWGGISLETSRDNVIRRNDILGNEEGIKLTSHNRSDSLKSEGKGVSISYNSQSAGYSGRTNNSIYKNNLSNKENAYDDGLNRWNAGREGNSYSDFDEPSEGCISEGKKTCNKEYRISGGSSVDKYPLATVATPRKFARPSGPGGSQLWLAKHSFLPGEEMRANFTAPAGFEAWAGIVRGNESGAVGATGNESKAIDAQGQSLGQNTSGSHSFTAPGDLGSYQLHMFDKNGTVLIAVPFNVSVPSITASPAEVKTCERIYVSFSGAPGLEKDWVGMYRQNGSDVVSQQMLGGRQTGTLAFSVTEAGTYEFRMFEGESGESQYLAQSPAPPQPMAESGPVTVTVWKGIKLIAEPSIVSPGGTITVTYWGAPASGTGVLGMYGITRPDKFHIEKRPLGRNICGSMAFRAPSQLGNYDFRMFENDVYRPIMAVSNGVTVR